MKFKPTVMLHGSVLKPLKEGQNEHVKFETEAVCYCINFYGDSAGIVTLAAQGNAMGILLIPIAKWK